MNSKITGTGSYLPKKILTNHDLEKMVDTSDEWIIERTGIEKRHIAEKGETTCDLAEGAGAVVLEATEEDEGILSTHLHADGHYKELLKTNGGVSSDPELLEAGGVFMEMKGNEVFKIAVNTLGRIVDETLAHNNMQKSDVDWLVPHQANIRIIKATAKKLKMSMDQVVVTVNEHGNTSAASVPLALDVAVRDGRIKRGERSRRLAPGVSR